MSIIHEAEAPFTTKATPDVGPLNQDGVMATLKDLEARVAALEAS